MSDTSDLLDYYQDQLIVQYKTLAKAQQTIRCLANNAICDGLPLQIQPSFALNTASGNQLTILGRIVGVPRNIQGLDLTHQFFNFTRYAGIPASNGFNRWITPVDSMLISTWHTNTSYTVTDFELRALINLRIIYNNAYESLYFIKNGLYGIFGSSIDVVDNKNTTITYNLQQPYYNVADVCSFLGNILPKPAGVGITINKI